MRARLHRLESNRLPKDRSIPELSSSSNLGVDVLAWVWVDWAEGQWLPWWNVCGRVYSLDSGSGYLEDGSGVGVVRQDFRPALFEHRPGQKVASATETCLQASVCPFVSPGPADACASPYLY